MFACCGTSVSFSAKMAQTHRDKTETENISKFVNITYQLMLNKGFPNPEKMLFASADTMESPIGKWFCLKIRVSFECF